MNEKYLRIIELLGEAHRCEMFATLRSRYAQEGDDAQEVLEAKENAYKCWAAAKYLYCLEKDTFDAYILELEPNDYLNTFNAMRQVVEKETNEQLEALLSD